MLSAADRETTAMDVGRRALAELARDPERAQDAVQEVYELLLSDLIFEVGLELHRSVKTGTYFLSGDPLWSGSAADPSSTSSAAPSSMATTSLSSSADDPENMMMDTAELANVDVFGQALTTTTSGTTSAAGSASVGGSAGVPPTLKKQLECVCPNCQRNLAASRFAPHLEKCMGMGRNSSRIASRRLASSAASSAASNNNNSSKDHHSSDLGGSAAGFAEDDAEDEDWLAPSSKGSSASGGRRRQQRDKNSPRRNRGGGGHHHHHHHHQHHHHVGGGGGKGYGSSSSAAGSSRALTSEEGSLTSAAAAAASTGGSSSTAYDQLSMEDRATLLSSICGVISATSGKICTRTTKCPAHNDVQRHEVRKRWLHHPAGAADDGLVAVDPNLDSLHDGETSSSSFRENMVVLQHLSNASSPAESTVSTSSNPSQRGRREKGRRGGGVKKGKGGGGGGGGSSRGSTPPLLLLHNND